jgi:hypothetical protein
MSARAPAQQRALAQHGQELELELHKAISTQDITF